ncbi:hypothetical protein AAVH_09454 [Aphelenchoides avenae]|nr:hypothetical protein AAVH_09454 [Aphelenchus avenae]
MPPTNLPTLVSTTPAHNPSLKARELVPLKAAEDREPHYRVPLRDAAKLPQEFAAQRGTAQEMQAAARSDRTAVDQNSNERKAVKGTDNAAVAAVQTSATKEESEANQSLIMPWTKNPTASAVSTGNVSDVCPVSGKDVPERMEDEDFDVPKSINGSDNADAAVPAVASKEVKPSWMLKWASVLAASKRSDADASAACPDSSTDVQESTKGEDNDVSNAARANDDAAAPNPAPRPKEESEVKRAWQLKWSNPRADSILRIANALMKCPVTRQEEAGGFPGEHHSEDAKNDRVEPDNDASPESLSAELRKLDLA